MNLYLNDLVKLMKLHWPENRTINIVCHGHSVPSGYFATPFVDSFNAYPHLLHKALKDRFPYAVINVIVTAIGGENSQTGSQRFLENVLCHKPDVITIDYGLNDRKLGLQKARESWSLMIKESLKGNTKVLLLTPTIDKTEFDNYQAEDKDLLRQHAEQIRELAKEFQVGLVDSYKACVEYGKDHDLSELLSWQNHPNRKGHELVVNEIMKWFPVITEF